MSVPPSTSTSPSPDTPPNPAPHEAPGGGDHVVVGRINGTWGLRGHVKITAYTSNPARFAQGAVLIVDGTPRKVLAVNLSQGYPIVQFEGYTHVDAAQVLRGTLIEIDAAELPPLPEGEYYRHDLIGLAVVTREGEHIGTLSDALTTGANDVYVIKREGKPDALIPAIPDVVLTVDIPTRTMTIEAMPGLLD